MKAKRYSAVTYVKQLFRSFVNSYLRHEYYTSIEDLSIYNWDKINEGHLSFLIKKKRFIHGRPDIIRRNMTDEFFSRFGLSKDLKKYLGKKRQLTMLICDNALRFDSAKQVRITLMRAELEAFEKKTTKVDFYQNVAMLSNFVGYRIDPKQTMVPEYFAMVERMNKTVSKGNDGSKSERGNRTRSIRPNHRRGEETHS